MTLPNPNPPASSPLSGSTGIVDLFSTDDGLFVTLRRLNAKVLSGLAFTQLDKDPSHYWGWIMDVANGGHYLAFYDNKIDQDIIQIWIEDPDSPTINANTTYAKKGLIKIGVLNGVPVQINDREIVTELDELKKKVKELEDLVLFLKQRTP